MSDIPLIEDIDVLQQALLNLPGHGRHCKCRLCDVTHLAARQLASLTAENATLRQELASARATLQEIAGPPNQRNIVDSIRQRPAIVWLREHKEV